MEYLALAVIIGIAGYVLFRQARKTWRGDSPCAGCTHNCQDNKTEKTSGCSSDPHTK